MPRVCCDITLRHPTVRVPRKIINHYSTRYIYELKNDAKSVGFVWEQALPWCMFHVAGDNPLLVTQCMRLFCYHGNQLVVTWHATPCPLTFLSGLFSQDKSEYSHGSCLWQWTNIHHQACRTLPTGRVTSQNTRDVGLLLGQRRIRSTILTTALGQRTVCSSQCNTFPPKMKRWGNIWSMLSKQR